MKVTIHEANHCPYCGRHSVGKLIQEVEADYIKDEIILREPLIVSGGQWIIVDMTSFGVEGNPFYCTHSMKIDKIKEK